MADIDDALTGICNLIGSAIYPNGTGQPSVTGLATIVYPGWPQSSQLDADMAGFANGKGGRIHVSVYPLSQEKVTTRYGSDFSMAQVPPTTLTLTVNGAQVTVGGSVTVPQNIGLVIGGKAYLYPVKVSDTPASIAAAIAAQIPGASASGAVITLPSAYPVPSPRVGTTGNALAMTKQQQRAVQITVWANSPQNRTATAEAIDAALSNIRFLTLPDGSSGRLLYQSSPWDDMTQKANTYRRDLIYTVEYPTTITTPASQVLTVEETYGVSMPDGSVNPVLDTFN